MSHENSALKSLLAGVAVLAVLVTLTGCSSGPASRPETAEEFAAATTIFRDEWGVPHVYGPTDESVVFGYMYAQAEDNFWQIEDSIIQAVGRSAEVYGEATVGADLLNRALEIVRLSQEETDRMSPEMKGLVRAGTEGLNHYLASHPEVEPRLIERFEPWHLAALSRFSVYQLFMMGKARIKGEEMALLATPVDGIMDKAASLEPSSSGWPAAAFEVAVNPRVQAADGEAIAGSNMWAVTPDRTQTDNALLFINPHQPYFGPGQWYEGHVDSEEGLHFSGAGFFGTFLPTIGHNETMGWSHTVNNPDILDVYLETFDDSENPLAYRYGDEYRQATSFTDTVSVRGEDGTLVATDYEFKKTHHGPIVGYRDGKGLALKMAKFEEGGQSEMRYRMAKATNVHQLKEAMSTLATPMFNTVAADAEGNIWYAYYGAVPRRNEGYDWSVPVDGSDPETEWQGYHPLEELPQVLNPGSGYVQNCNATPFLASGDGDNPKKDDFPSYMAPEDDNPRSRISRRILEGDHRFGFDQWAELAFDTRVIEGEVWIPRLAEALGSLSANSSRARKLAPGLELLEGWDNVSTKESTEMTLFFKWREVMIQGRVEDLLDSFEMAMDTLESNWGTWAVAWGEINRVQRIHTSGVGEFSDERESLAVAGGPGPLGIVFNFYTRPVEGQQRRYGVAGHSYASVVEFDEGEAKARSILVFGQNADEASPHYFDQARLFADGQFKPAWFSKTDVEANAVSDYHPGELRSKSSTPPLGTEATASAQ